VTATYTEDQAVAGAPDRRGAKPAAVEFVMTSATPELTSTPHVPGQWSGRSKLALFLGATIGFWGLVAGLVLWLVN
jgi:hypothetical protein